MTILFASTFRQPFGDDLIGNRFGVHDIENGHDLYGPQGHRGVDFVVPAGTRIPAIANGHVWHVFRSNVLGNVVVLRHYLHGDDNDVYSGYAHLSVPLVKPGQDVKIGQPVAESGATGAAAHGAHLHLTLSRAPLGVEYGDVVDPLAYINELSSKPVAVRPKPVLFTTARPGEGLSVIAQRSGKTLATIERLNPDVTPPSYIVQLGQRIRIQ